MNKAIANEALGLYETIERHQKVLASLASFRANPAALDISLIGAVKSSGTWTRDEVQYRHQVRTSTLSPLAEMLVTHFEKEQQAAIAAAKRRLAQLGFKAPETSI